MGKLTLDSGESLGGDMATSSVLSLGGSWTREAPLGGGLAGCEKWTWLKGQHAYSS